MHFCTRKSRKMKADLLLLLAGIEKAPPLAVVQYFVGMTSWCFSFLFAHNRWLRGVRGICCIHTGPRGVAALRALQALEVLVAGAEGISSRALKVFVADAGAAALRALQALKVFVAGS